MGSQAQQAVSHAAATEAAPTRRQIAARKRAERMKAVNAAAKAWLATRKGSKTPVADRLIARHMSKTGTDAMSARQLLESSLTRRSGLKKASIQGHDLANELRGLFFSTAGTCLADAVALMQEAGIPAKYWGKAAMKLAEQKQAKARAAKKQVLSKMETPENTPHAATQKAQAANKPAFAQAA